MSALKVIREVVDPYVMRVVPGWLREQVGRILATTIAFFFAFTLGADSRYSAAAYKGLRVFMPVHVWGSLFGIAALCIIGGILSKRLRLLGQGLVLTATLHIFIAVGFFIQACHDQRASFAGAVAFSSIAASIIAARMRLAQNTGA